MEWPGKSVLLFGELDAWSTSIGETVEVERRTDATPFPLVILRGRTFGDTCVIADAGGRYLVRAHGSELVMAVQPRSGVLAALLQRFDRAPMLEVRGSIKGKERDAWLEVDGFPVLWVLGHAVTTRIRMRSATWSEQRREVRAGPAPEAL